MSDAQVRRLVRKHPLQRLSSPSRGASALLHILGLSSFAYSFNFLVNNPNQMSEAYGWHYQFLTIIGLSLVTVTFSAGLLADLTMSPRIFLIKNALEVASAPLEVLISILYWSLKAIDPKLVVADFLPPLALEPDLAFHAIPSAVMVLDILLFSPPWTITFVPATLISAVIAFGYWFWVELCYSHNNFYPYPLFDQLPTAGRIALFAGSAVVMAGSTMMLRWLYGIVNGTQVPGEKPGAVKGE